ncbi:hypothetical protein DE146DRAFT_107476 [Phaeosphaeria sp. MPI-PUGE-AT-0046c]|nr:hypothetical protein DE146DRAFT_107476 [Phaeosphaeria sp. MPI-PUGE-AT-0046c]
MTPRAGPEPTYYIPPSLDVHPDGVLALGNVFADPLYPEVPLSRQDPTDKPTSTDVLETPGPLFEDRTRLEGFRIWTKVLDIFQMKLGGAHREHRFVGHWPEKIVTEVMDVPTLDAILKRVQNDTALKKHLKLEGIGFGNPVYMVAGRKVATNVRYTYQNDTNLQFETTMAATAQPSGTNISAGASAEVGAEDRSGRAGIIHGDIVFAYKLLEISPKGFWKNKNDVGMSVYRKDALLSAKENLKDAGDAGVDARWLFATETCDEEAEIVALVDGGAGSGSLLVVRRDLD